MKGTIRKELVFPFFPFKIQIFMFSAKCLPEVIIGVDGLIFYAKENKKESLTIFLLQNFHKCISSRFSSCASILTKKSFHHIRVS